MQWICRTDEEEESFCGPYHGLVEAPATALWVMGFVINDSAVVFSLVCVDGCIAPDNLSVQSSSAPLRPVFMPHIIKLVPNRFGPAI